MRTRYDIADAALAARAAALETRHHLVYLDTPLVADAATTYRTADGGNVTAGSFGGEPAVRFSCDGMRYQIDGSHQADGSDLTVDHLAPVASAMSRALGCTPVSTDAPSTG